MVYKIINTIIDNPQQKPHVEKQTLCIAFNSRLNQFVHKAKEKQNLIF